MALGTSQVGFAELYNLILMLFARSGAARLAPLKTATLQILGLTQTFSQVEMPNSPASIAGTIRELHVVMGQTPWSTGESVSITIAKKSSSNGFIYQIPILTTPIVLNAATALVATNVNYLADLAVTSIAVGDEIIVSGAYTAGGAPNHPDFSINLVWI
jgi:ribosomal protein L30/L7E